MCGQNSLCNAPDGFCNCSGFTMPLSLNQSLSMLISMIYSKNQMLSDLTHQLNEIQKRVDLLHANREASVISNAQEISTQGTILKLMRTEPIYEHKLKLLIEPPKILYKERNFSFKCFVEDQQASRLKLKSNLSFSLILFTVDNPPNELQQNTSGDRIIRWTYEINQDVIEFRKICINEVSSHYRSSVFCLGVKCEDNCRIEPLVIPDVKCSAPVDVPATTWSLNTIYTFLTSKTLLLKELSSVVTEIDKKLDSFIKDSHSQTQNSQYEIASPSIILKTINPSTIFHFRLEAIDEHPSLIYKERNFSLKFRIINKNDFPVTLTNPAVFRLSLFTVDNPPCDLMKTNDKRKILRGNVEVITNHEVEFRKICISQVSSHYRNGVFCLAVVPDPNTSIQPFIIPDVTVKARKILVEPRKIRKSQEADKIELQ